MSDDGDEVIWATSTTGDDFRCVHVDDWRIAKARIAELEAALTDAHAILKSLATAPVHILDSLCEPSVLHAALRKIEDLRKPE